MSRMPHGLQETLWICFGILCWLAVLAIVAAPWVLAYAVDHIAMSKDTQDLLNVLSGIGIVLEILAIPVIGMALFLAICYAIKEGLKTFVIKSIFRALGDEDF